MDEMTRVYDLGDDWEMTVDLTGGLPRMQLHWIGDGPCWEMEIPPDMPEEEQISKARMLARVYQKGYWHGAADERREIIKDLGGVMAG